MVNDTEPTIEIRDLDFSHREGTFHLRFPMLSVEAGETVAVIGPSGTGKTTLFVFCQQRRDRFKL